MVLLCECNAASCRKTIDVPLEEAKRITAPYNSVIIVDGCRPEPTDVLVSKESGYSMYKEE